MSLLMWRLAFLAVSGEWFLMRQSRLWNGPEAAFRIFTVIGMVLLIVIQSDGERTATQRPPVTNVT
jgi:predicted small integral membrane protein